MAQLFQFDENQQGRRPLCIACEEMLTDALDGTLPAADQAWFDRHVDSCMDCSQMVADAERGAAWLEMLKSPRPEPSASLLERIIAQTSGAQTSGAQTSGAQTSGQAAPAVLGQPAILPGSVPAAPGAANVLAFRPRLRKFAARFGAGAGAGFEPRLAMTAAMAFFSIALTLNLAGVRLDQLRARDLSPSKVKQSYYEASAEAVRYYDNLRVVRVVESRVEQVQSENLKNQNDDRAVPTAAPAKPQQEPPRENKEGKQDSKPGGSSRSESPFVKPRLQQVADRSSKSQEGGLV